MTFLRNLAADLVAKRLWPLAAVLIVALVAIPVLVTGSAQEPSELSVANAGPATGAAPAVAVAEERPRGGRGPIGRNPFAQKDVRPAVREDAVVNPFGLPSAQGPATAGSPSRFTIRGGSTSGSSSGSSSAARAGDDSWADVQTGSIPGLDDVDVVPVGNGSDGASKSDERASWHVDLRLGRDGRTARRSDVPRLTPLPSADDPFFVFLGVAADGKTALFLVSSDAEATGDGKCLPSPQNCERLEMRAGQTEFFDVKTDGGETVQYELGVSRVARRTQASTAVAAAARTRESSSGRRVLRTVVESGAVEVSDLAYSRELGLVVPTGARAEQAESLFGGFRIDLRFGAPGDPVKRYNLARLTPLPSVETPSFVYLGVLDDGETALFLNPTEAAVSGDAVCLPSPAECQRIELKAGQRSVLSAPTLNGQVERYELTIDGISKLKVDTEAEARASIRRESPAGRRILRRLVTEVGSLVGDLSFSAESGTLEPAE